MFELPDDIFLSVIGQLNLKFDPRRGDKRANPRVRVGRRAAVIRTETKSRRKRTPASQPAALIRELSVTGAGLLLPDSVKAGDEFVLMLPRTTGAPVPLQCRVVRCNRCGSDAATYAVGVEFLCQLSPEDVTPDALEIRRIRRAILAD